jgi:ubiquitin C-terminal hydrolase
MDSGRTVKTGLKSLSEPIKEMLSLYKSTTMIIQDDKYSLDEKRTAQDKWNIFIKEHKKEQWLYKSYIYWKNHLEKGKSSLITDYFSGVFCSVVTTENKIEYPTFSAFTIITLPIPSTTRWDAKLTLDDCFKKYTDTEELEDLYYCDHEKKKVKATKKMYVWQPPKVLVIHLNRFEHNGYHVNKINKRVEYPLKDFELGDYYSEFKSHDYKYELTGVSLHSGGAKGGHYTAYRKNKINNVWYNCNDSSVNYIEESAVEGTIVSNNAYILVYRRQE